MRAALVGALGRGSVSGSQTFVTVNTGLFFVIPDCDVLVVNLYGGGGGGGYGSAFGYAGNASQLMVDQGAEGYGNLLTADGGRGGCEEAPQNFGAGTGTLATGLVGTITGAGNGGGPGGGPGGRITISNLMGQTCTPFGKRGGAGGENSPVTIVAGLTLQIVLGYGGAGAAGFPPDPGGSAGFNGVATLTWS